MRIKVPDEDLHFFSEVGTEIRYRSGEFIFTRGDEADKIYIIKSGRVLVSVTTEEGDELSFDVLKKGHIFGDGAFLAHYQREVDISAVTDVELVVCRTADLIPVLATNQDLMILMFRHITEVTNEMSRQLVRLMRYSGTQKVADLILSGTAASNTLPYTHSDIASALGMNRVTVSRIMKDLRARGLIDYSYGVVTVCDRQGLASLLEEKNE